jgi:sporulation protein YlmC with PRC-barrel domain
MSDHRNLPAPPKVAGRILDAGLDLLDRQILDPDGVPVTTVDDLEFTSPDDPSRLDPEHPPLLDALLTGPILATRIFGGRLPDSRFIRIPWKVVADVGTVVKVGVAADSLDASWTERWMRDHVIARIPGGRHDPE